MSDAYHKFLEAKIELDGADGGLPCEPSEVHPLLKPHQRDVVAWAVRGGRRAIFEAFGLGKTLQQLEVLRLVLAKSGGKRGLIVCPLGVRQEFARDAQRIGIVTRFVRTTEEATTEEIDGHHPIYLTNYESVRERKIDPRVFDAVSLDEAAILRGFGGTKTFREFMRLFEGTATYRFVATATPSPNEFIELLAYAAFLGVMEVSEAKTRFFKRDSTKADKLTLHAHKETEFWLWVASWAIFLQRPSDLGYSDEGYELPPLDVRWHEVRTDHRNAGQEPDGQMRMLKDAAIGVQDAAREKRDSLPARIQELLAIRAEEPDEHRIIWHDLEAERAAIEDAIPSAVTVYGAQDLDEREQAVADFSDGKFAELAAKPVMLGAGCNLQRHCARAVYLGIGFKFNDFIQSVHRIQRFLQGRKVRIDLIYTEAEREIRRQLERKWRQHEELVAQMTTIIRRYGLSHQALRGALKRGLGCERSEASGKGWKLVNNDCVDETRRMASDSVGLILTSIPFSMQYEYSPNWADFGHTDSNEHFWQQMEFLIPELLRVLKPGRDCVIHVKDRIVPGGLTGVGFQTTYPFHKDAIDSFSTCPQCRVKRAQMLLSTHEHQSELKARYFFCDHRFTYLGMKTIVTDVVRENNQTYRLGWTEQCKDGSRMGVGMPEYLLLFRKPPTDRSNGYADEPVEKDKAEYSRSRWQIDAHGFERSSGNRLLTAKDIAGIPHERIFKLFRKYSATEVYDYERHVALSESLERCGQCGHIHIGDRKCGNIVPQWGVECPCTINGGRLPTTFMLLQPASWHPDVWTDITRMRTLNSSQQAKGREMHLCPMQFDVANRVIRQMSAPGDVVFDPFGGIGTVPLCALEQGREGWGCELSATYHADAVDYLRAAERRQDVPDLFEMVEAAAEQSA